MVYECGEKPGVGIYICRNCGAHKHLDNSTDVLPPCSVCDHCTYDKA